MHVCTGCSWAWLFSRLIYLGVLLPWPPGRARGAACLGFLGFFLPFFRCLVRRALFAARPSSAAAHAVTGGGAFARLARPLQACAVGQKKRPLGGPAAPPVSFVNLALLSQEIG